MTEQVVVFASIISKPDCVEKVRALLLGAVEPSRQEEGCIKYDLHQSTDEPNSFMFYEVWKNDQHFQAHTKMPHFEYLVKNLEGITESIKVQTMKLLE